MRSLISFLGIFFVSISVAEAQANRIVVSQIYGGGGNSGAPLRSDFIELFNRGTVAVDITGWTVQYASSAGSSWDRTLLAGTIQPGRYYLVAEHLGDTGASLPAADATGGLNLSATTGKVALVTNDTILTGTAPSGPAIVDFVGYGNANASEGRPAPSISNTTSAQRRGNGCIDTNQNADDFTTGTPQPRNRFSALVSCGSSPTSPIISQNGITNAASYSAGSVAPGEIVTIFGSGLGPQQIQTLQLTAGGTVATTLGGTRVFFGDVAAPLIYTLENQVSAVVPYIVASSVSVDVRVDFGGQTSASVQVPVAAAVPGIFTIDSSGTGQGAIQNEDYTINGPQRAARVGSVVTIYGTGAGSTEPGVADGAVVGLPLPYIKEPVSVRIGGQVAEVLYAGMAPSLVNGVFQINARIPASITVGGPLPIEVQVGATVSQAGVSVFVQAPAGSVAGTGPLIEEKLRMLRASADVASLPEFPHDRIGVPPGWLSLLSWNIQVGGTSTAPGALRPPMVKEVLGSMFGGTYPILAAQEIPNRDSATLLTSLLPGGALNWRSSFIDCTDSMDNGFWFRDGVVLRDAFLLGVTDRTEAGVAVTNPQLAVHPPQVAQFEIANFDFTLITLHLTFADGDTAESIREFRHVLDYLDWYFAQPDHDPDVILCGDFNTPSTQSGQKGRGGITLDSVFDADPRFQDGERRFVVLVHQPTSRSSQANGGVPVNNYDHCVLSADTLEEFVAARRVDTSLLTDLPADPEMRLTSDHFPIVSFFRVVGEGVVLDRQFRLR